MRERLRPYWLALPDILKYQVLTKVLIGLWIFLLGSVTQALLASTGRVAVTSGDFTFLLGSWQGILIILVGLISLFVYVDLDLNCKIILGRNIVTGEEVSIWNSIKEGFTSIKGLFSVRGAVIALYIALIAPLLGIGVSISFTEGLYIPTFISSVIQSTPLYLALVVIFGFAFLCLGVGDLFILHGMVIDKMSAKDAGIQSRRLMKANWKDYIKQNILFIVVMGVILLAVMLITLVLPLTLIRNASSLSPEVSRALTILFVMLGATLSLLTDLLVTPLYLLKMTQLFYSYKKGEAVEYAHRDQVSHPHYLTEIALGLLIVIAVTVITYTHFDSMFPMTSDVKVIAHRGGGSEAAENTIAGFETAWKAGAYGSETDIQRTKDGHYILNHDGTFKRVAGVDKRPEEMTLREIRKLSVDGEPIPTLEETLEACRGNIVLFIELKGKTADRQMADDAVRTIREYGMEKECVLISLKYELIDYIEREYPDIQTGFLVFASVGDTSLLNCDYLGLEEESATADAIAAVHSQDKKALVWTANEEKSQRNFLCSSADGIITDNISQAVKIRGGLADRSDLDRMIDRIKWLF